MTLPDLDKEGYLADLSDWSPEVAVHLAAEEGIQLNERHMELIELVRAYYEEKEVAPAMRPLVRLVKQRLGAERGNSIYLMGLFPQSPAKQLARIAGLPRPTNCI